MTLLQSTEILIPIQPHAGVLYTFLFTCTHLCSQYWNNLKLLVLGTGTLGIVTPTMSDLRTWTGIQDWLSNIPTYTPSIVLSNCLSSYYGCIPYMSAIYLMNYHVVYGISKQFVITIL